MTVQFKNQWNGFEQDQVVGGLAPAEETRLIGLQICRAVSNGVETAPAGVRSFANTALPNAGRGTLICDWSSGLVGNAAAADVYPEAGNTSGVVVQIANGSTAVYALANAGAQSSAMNCALVRLKAAKRADGQAYNVVYLEFGTDNTFTNRMFVGLSVACDGVSRDYITPAQAAWGTSGAFTIGVTQFTHVQVRESSSFSTGSGRPALQAGQAIQIGEVRRNPAGHAMAVTRWDDGLPDMMVARLALSVDFVGLSGVTIPAGVPQSGLSLARAFGVPMTAYILTRHVGDVANGFLTAAQLREFQDVYDNDVAFQTHLNPISSTNKGARLLGPDGYNIMPVGQVSAVNTGTGQITTTPDHAVTTTSGVGGNQGFPVTLIGSDFPVPANGAPLVAGGELWLRSVSAKVVTAHRTEADSCNGVNAITYSAAGIPANWGWRYRGSANDSSAIAADFAIGQAKMREWGFKAWRHYAANQGAYDVWTEAPILALRAAGDLLSSAMTFGNSGIATNNYLPRIGIGHPSGGIGGIATSPQGLSAGHWLTFPTAIDTHNGGADAQATIRAFVDDAVKRGAIVFCYHHMFSTEASMRNYCAWLDQCKLRADQGLLRLGKATTAWHGLVATGTAL